MEHFIRIAFWIVALAACLQGMALPLTQMDDWNTELLMRAECTGTFYSPTNVKKECFIKAMNCVKAELEVARSECNDREERISQGLHTVNNTLLKMRGKSNQTVNNSNECDCHMWSARPFGTFVNDVKTLLENINEKFSLPRNTAQSPK